MSALNSKPLSAFSSWLCSTNSGASLRTSNGATKSQPLDLTEATTDVARLAKRATVALRNLRRLAPDCVDTIDDLDHTLLEIKALFDRAENRIAEVETENRQMIQIAGVGLLVEVVAHELARSTENALAALTALRHSEIPDHTAPLLDSLRSEMTAVSKRLRVLDPLSVSGRQRKEVFDLGALIDDVLSGHELQFDRHHVRHTMTLPRHPVRVRAVKGMIVQIIENLISNSLYWLDLRMQHEPGFGPHLTITLDRDPLTLTYQDNGRGIAQANRDRVFGAFYSLKEKKHRRGLGLYIARDCAEYHGGTLTCVDASAKCKLLLRDLVLEFCYADSPPTTGRLPKPARASVEERPAFRLADKSFPHGRPRRSPRRGRSGAEEPRSGLTAAVGRARG